MKAEVRQDTTIKTLEYYSNKLIQLPDELIGVLVTHMDQVMYDDDSIKKVIIQHEGYKVDMLDSSHPKTQHSAAKYFTQYSFELDLIGINNIIRFIELIINEFKHIVRCLQVINRKFGIEDVVCTQLDDPRYKLVAKIRKSCEGHKPQKLTVDSALFLKLFDIRESDRKPLK